jgi:hypothetical protein
MREYFVEGRSVWEQELNMNLKQRRQLFRDLLINAQPENRAYEYDFFYDNCATRVRDMLLEQKDRSKLQFQNADAVQGLSFRDAIHPYLQSKPWTRLGIDLILGIPADKQTDSLSVMFLPDHLMDQFAGISISQPGQNRKPFIENEKQLLDFPSTDNSPVSKSSPGLLLWVGAVLIIFLSVAEFYGFIKLKWFDKVLFTIVGAAGFVIAYLWFVSHHEVTGPNLNILWAHPLWFLLIRRKRSFYTNLLRYVTLIFLVFMIFGFAALPQSIPGEFLPLWLILTARLGVELFPRKIRQK